MIEYDYIVAYDIASRFMDEKAVTRQDRILHAVAGHSANAQRLHIY
jgi:hypothetical protein